MRPLPPTFQTAGRLVVDVETWGNGTPRMIGIGCPGDPRPQVFWDLDESFLAWMRSRTGWTGYAGNADRHFLSRVDVALPDLDDVMLRLHLADETVGRNAPADETVAASLKERARHHLGWPDWSLPGLADDRRDAIPNEVLGRYCAIDVAATMALDEFADRELKAHPQWGRLYRYITKPLNDALYGIERCGIPIDADALRDYTRVQLQRRRREIVERMNSMIGRASVNWRSTEQVMEVLYGELRLPPQAKWSSSRGRRAYTIDKSARMAIIAEHPLVGLYDEYQDVIQQREMMGEETGWLSKLRDDRLHPSLNAAGTVTGRLAGRNPNPQNFPRDPAVRRFVRAPEGKVILSADYKCLEFGVASWLYDEPAMRAAYLSGDPHSATARGLYGTDRITKDERSIGKTANFALLYQQGDESFYSFGLKNGLRWTPEEAAEKRSTWLRLYPGVEAAWQKIREAAEEAGYIETFSGRWRRLPEIKRDRTERVRRRAWRQACNAVVQTPAAEFAHVSAILATTQHGDLLDEPILHVHDALVFLVDVDLAREAARVLRQVMEIETPEYYRQHLERMIGIPLRVEIGVGPTWGDLSKVV